MGQSLETVTGTPIRAGRFASPQAVDGRLKLLPGYGVICLGQGWHLWSIALFLGRGELISKELFPYFSNVLWGSEHVAVVVAGQVGRVVWEHIHKIKYLASVAHLVSPHQGRVVFLWRKDFVTRIFDCDAYGLVPRRFN